VIDSDGALASASAADCTTSARLPNARPNPILILINGLDRLIIHATTREIIRGLIFNPAVDYQPQGVFANSETPRCGSVRRTW
jgi:hypothetical protein